MSKPLTRDEIVTAIRQATGTGESVNSYALHDRVCRADAVGRISAKDSEYFDEVLAGMVDAGEIRKNGPFISSAARWGNEAS
jgi:hypothetical protein